MDSTKFVLLQEPIAASEATNLLCHVVASKASPQLAHAPFNANNAPRHSTTTLATTKRLKSTKLDNFMATAIEQGVGSQVAGLLNLTGPYADELQENRLVKGYVLKRSQPAFQELMASEKYCKEVCSLLERCIQRQGFLVTGFLTVTSDSWLTGTSPEEMSQFDDISSSHEGGVVPIPFLYDDIMDPELARLAEACPEPSYLANEQIFAISYKTAKLPPEQSPFGRHVSPTPAMARPRRSNAYHLAPSQADHTWVRQQVSRALHASSETVTLDDDERRTDFTADDEFFIFL